MLAKEFIKWVIISVAIACPVGYIIMNKWLQNFAYRTTVAWWIFALAILIAFLIAFATVTWHSLKTARTNPVEALRYE
jgi:putative ABC transport system permease protein